MTLAWIVLAGVGAASAVTGCARVPASTASAGRVELGLGGRRDGSVYLPRGHRPDRPAPLLVLFHGAGAGGAQMIDHLSRWADAHGVVLLAPDSRSSSWDLMTGGLGPDLAFLDRALAEVFRRWRIDRTRVAVGGFSDGASYALTVGLMQGDRFGHVLAFSPGYMAPREQRGRPRIFVSHGVKDRVLPIDDCAREIRRTLLADGYPLRYQEFDGAHAVPPEIARAAVEWWLADPPSGG
jgi:phospholipase/carboxylesterase